MENIYRVTYGDKHSIDTPYKRKAEQRKHELEQQGHTDVRLEIVYR